MDLNVFRKARIGWATRENGFVDCDPGFYVTPCTLFGPLDCDPGFYVDIDTDGLLHRNDGFYINPFKLSEEDNE